MKYNKLFLKITTIPNQLDVDIDSKELQVFRNKYESHKSFIKDSDVELAYLNESSVNGSFAKIYSITLGFIDENVPIVKTIYGEETDLLDKLLSILRLKDFSNSSVIMYNRAFILTFLSKRLRKHKYPISMLPVSLQSFDKKAWTIKGSKCIQDYVKGIGWQTENFSETCFIHSVNDEGIIEGSDVARYFKKEQFDLIHSSDIKYVYALMQIDNQLSEETTLNDLNGTSEAIGKVVKQEVNVLEHILASGNLTSAVIKEIVKFTEEENLDKQDVLTLVKTAISKNRLYQKVEKEDFIDLQDALGLTLDCSDILEVYRKGNLGKAEMKSIFENHKDISLERKNGGILLIRRLLIQENKINQKSTTKYLKEIYDYFIIAEVVLKENLGAKEVKSLVIKYKDSIHKEEVVKQVEKYLIKNKKITQKRTKEAFSLLKKSLL